MVTNERANFIAHDWIDAWNRRDLERMMQYYDRRICHTSPKAFQFNKGSKRTVRGIKNMRKYFLAGMRRFKDIYFEIVDILIGVDSISIIYRTSNNSKAIETMFLNDEGKVCRSYAYYDN